MTDCERAISNYSLDFYHLSSLSFIDYFIFRTVSTLADCTERHLGKTVQVCGLFYSIDHIIRYSNIKFHLTRPSIQR